MTDQRPGDIVPHQKMIEDVIDARIATIAKGGFLPDYANAVVITNPSPSQLIATGNLFAQFTPQSAGWTLVIVRYELQVVGHASVSLDIEAVDTTVIYDAATLEGVASGPNLMLEGDMHALVPGDSDYAISGSAHIFDSGLAEIVSITEVPALA